jgi:hypothetical protein
VPRFQSNRDYKKPAIFHGPGWQQISCRSVYKRFLVAPMLFELRHCRTYSRTLMFQIEMGEYSILDCNFDMLAFFPIVALPLPSLPFKEGFQT